MDWKARYESLKAMREIEWATEEMRRMRDTVAEARAEAAKARRRKREVLAQLKERDASLALLGEVIDEAMRGWAEAEGVARDGKCQESPCQACEERKARLAALRARVNALRNGETP